MQTVLIRPAIDTATGKPYKIRLPNKPDVFLPDDGAVVVKTKFWIRRLRDGSVIDVKTPKVSKTATKNKE